MLINLKLLILFWSVFSYSQKIDVIQDESDIFLPRSLYNLSIEHDFEFQKHTFFNSNFILDSSHYFVRYNPFLKLNDDFILNANSFNFILTPNILVNAFTGINIDTLNPYGAKTVATGIISGAVGILFDKVQK